MSSTVLYDTNKYQTPITRQLKEELDPEVFANLMEFINSVHFVKRLVAKDRPTVKEMPKDKRGRVIVDFTNPHILEDMEYFIQDRIRFEKYGYYTAAKFSKNPNSDYIRYWDEQMRRSLEGYVNKKTGEWIPGYLYFYWNYGIILKTKETGDIVNGKVRSDRIEAFPDIWEIDYFYFHYLEQAESAGEYAALLKCRGMGASFKSASMAIRNFFLIKKSKTFLTASFDGYLFEDGIVTKFVDMETFMQTNTAFKKRKLISKPSHYKSGYKDKAKNNAHAGFLSEMMTVNTKDPNSIRGKRGKLIIHEEFGSNRRGLDAWRIADRSLNDRGNVFGMQLGQGCVCKGTDVMLSSGEVIPVEEITKEDKIVGYDGVTTVGQSISYIKPVAIKDCVEITLYGGDKLECSTDHPLLQLVENTSKGAYRATFVEAQTLKKGLKIAVPDKIGKFGDIKEDDSRLLGLLVGDGSYGHGITPEIYTDTKAVSEYISSNYNTSLKNKFLQKNGREFTSYRVKGITSKLKSLGIQGQTKDNKRFPDNIHLWDKKSTADFIAGYYDADGNVKYRKDKDVVIVVLSSAVYELLYSMRLLLQKFGIHSSIVKEKRNTKPSKGYEGQKNHIWRLYINNQYDVRLFYENFKLLSKHKQRVLKKITKIHKDRNNSKIVKSAYFKKGSLNKGQFFEGKTDMTNLRYKIVKSIKYIGKKDVYNLTASGTHTYIANGLITHNTGGDDQADFFSLTQIFFKPKSFNVHAIPNVFDKNSMTSTSGFFMGDYMNKPRSYNKNGVTDVVKTLISIFKDRKQYESELDDPDEIAKKKAETAITPLEAITVMQDSVFPKDLAKQAIADLSANYEERTKGFHICRLRRIGDKVSLIHSSEYFPILEYPYTGKQSHKAAVVIKSMPARLSDETIPAMRYIIGVDTLEDDDTSGSLFSVQVMDLWKDDIVAWYLGRHVMISEDYDIVLNLCLLYNATCNYENNLKGLYAHFRNHNALRYLADTPDILLDKGYTKTKGRIGNSSKGTRATGPVNAWGRRLQAEWMRKPHNYYTDKLGIETIDDIEYLREIHMFDPFGNFDKISSGNMLFIYREDLVKITESSKFDNQQTNDDYNSDDFFDDFTPVLNEDEDL